MGKFDPAQGRKLNLMSNLMKQADIGCRYGYDQSVIVTYILDNIFKVVTYMYIPYTTLSYLVYCFS